MNERKKEALLKYLGDYYPKKKSKLLKKMDRQKLSDGEKFLWAEGYWYTKTELIGFLRE